MQSRSVNGRITLKHDSRSNWDKATNFIPKSGEIIIYDAEGDIAPRIKIGDGVTNINQLLFSTTGISNHNNGEIFNNYINNQAIGEYSHAEGNNTLAEGVSSHAEGWSTMAFGRSSHASGEQTIAGGKGYKITYVETVTDENNTSVNNIGFEIGSLTEQEFLNTCNWQAGDIFSVSVDGYYQWDFCGTLTGAPRFDEGIVYWSCTTADYGDKKLSDLSDAELTSTHISVIYVPTKPCGTITVGSHAHAEGYNTVAASRYAHAEGYQNQAGYSAHAEGQSTIAKGLNSHSEGYKTKAIGATSHAEGSQTQAIGDISHAEGYKTESSGARSHAEGYQTTAAGKTSHAEGQSTQAIGEASHAEGFGSDAIGIYAHAEGYITESSGAYSHAEGQQTTATGVASHSEGRLAKATGSESHAEGYNTKAIGSRSHAEGRMTTAQGDCSHSEGSGTLAVGARSHAEGINTIAYSADSHVEGSNTIAGTVNKTAKSQGVHVQGRYNLEDKEEKYAHIVGNGSSGGRSNAHTLDWSGNAWFAGDVESGSGKLATESYVEDKLANAKTNSDWSENDENSSAYIKNRTHWHQEEKVGKLLANETTIRDELYNFNYRTDPIRVYVDGVKYDTKIEKLYYHEDLGTWFSEIKAGGLSIVFTEDPGAEINISGNYSSFEIYELQEEKYHKLDKNYLPDDIVNKDEFPAMSKGDEESSIIANDIATNVTLGANSTVFGVNNIAGAKGFYIKNLDVTNKKIHLTTIECNPTFEVNYSNEVADSTVDITGYEVGDYIDITAYKHYHWILCTKISEVGSDYVVYETDINDSRNILTNLTDEETGEQKDVKYILSVPSKPQIGSFVYTDTSFAEGGSNIAAGQFAHVEGFSNISSGRYSHAEGLETVSGYAAHAEGQATKATAINSHAEGYMTESTGSTSHAEGYKSKSIGSYSHAEGSATEAGGQYAHSEGSKTTASGEASHAEGYGSKASGTYSHAEGRDAKAFGEYSHSEGHLSQALNEASHAEGYNTEAKGKRSHAEGRMTKAIGENSHAEGSSTEAHGPRSHAEGGSTKVYASDGHAEGSNTIAGTINGTSKSQGAHVQGRWNIEDTEEKYAHIVGNGKSSNRSNAHTLDWEGNAWFAGDVESSEGKLASVNYVDGRYVTAGQRAGTTLGYKATAEGYMTKASGDYSHAEGCYTNASHPYSHAEDYGTTASGSFSHAEGYYTTASREASHAEGIYTYASGRYSHAEGDNTIASGEASHVQGKWNIEDTEDKYAHIVGNGTDKDNRSNAHTLDWDGNAWFAGTIESGEGKLATEGYVNEQIENIEIPGVDLTGYATEAYVNKHRVIAGKKANTDLGSEATAEGHATTASGDYSHAEGNQSEATGAVSHAEGTLTKAIGKDSHAEGNRCEAKGQMSHAEGQGTIASSACIGQHVQGRYNIEDTAGNYAHIVGNGGAKLRKNIHTLDWDGNAWYQGTITTGTSTAPHRGILIGTNEPSDSLGVDGDIYIMYEE